MVNGPAIPVSSEGGKVPPSFSNSDVQSHNVTFADAVHADGVRSVAGATFNDLGSTAGCYVCREHAGGEGR